MIRQSLIEHEALVAEAGVPRLLRKTGWLKLYRSEASLAKAVHEVTRARDYGVDNEVLDAKAIAAREPQLTGAFAGGVYLPTPGFVPDPGGLAKAYAACSVAAASGPLVRFRPSASWLDAWTGHRPAARGDDDRRGAVRRYRSISAERFG